MSTPYRALIVDGDPVSVLTLERLVRASRPTWSMFSTTSARTALGLLDRESFHVIVSGTRATDMEGSSFLAFAHEHHPETMRLLLSAPSEKLAALRAMPHVHRHLPKPCPPAALLEILYRRTKSHFRDPRVMALIGGIESLPCDRAALYRLSELVATPNRRIDDVADVIEHDPALAANLLRLAQMPFFTAHRRESIRDVVASGGIDLVRTLEETACAASSRAIAATQFDGSSLRLHASAVATLAKTASGDSPFAETCFLAGLLHGIGKWVLATYAPQTYDLVVTRARHEGITYEEAEERENAPSHTAIGAALLDLWGIAPAIVDAVGRQNVREHEVTDLETAAPVRLAKLRLAVPAPRRAA